MSKRDEEKQRRRYDAGVIKRLSQTFYPRHDPPASFDKPVNGTKEQKREWEIKMIAWTLDWLEAVFEPPFRPVEGHFRYTPDGDLIVRVSAELAQALAQEAKEREARQRRLAAALAEFPDDLQRKPPPPAPPPTNEPRTQEK